MAYPTGTELIDALVLRGVFETPSHPTATFSAIMSGIVQRFERETGWVPFLSAGSDSSRTFDPPHGSHILFLNAGLVSIDEITVTDDVQTVEEHYWPKPSTVPYTRIDFSYVPGGNPSSIEITGEWGYCDTLPADVTSALLNAGIAEYLRTVSNPFVGIGGAPKRIKQDDVEKDYGDNGGLVRLFDAEYQNCVARYLAPWKVLA